MLGSDISMDKINMRKKYKEIRRNIKNKELKDNNIYHKVINEKNIIDADTLLIYVSKREEIDTIKLMKHYFSNKKIAVPKICNGTMEFYYIDNIDELKIGYYDILEPITNKVVLNYNNSVCIVPGICFDKENYRIGYGKGYYDKFLTEHKVFSIGLCYKECLVSKIEKDIHDISVDKVITD